MRVVHISTADNIGGSGRSAYKIHKGLEALGVESKMLVGYKSCADDTVEKISDGINALSDKIVGKITNQLSMQYLFLPSSIRLLKTPQIKSADIIQLYNTHGNYFSHSVLPALSRLKHVFWRLSDMWPMTGHCTYSGDCSLWMTGCKSCPDLANYPSLTFDTAGLLWKWKKSLYSRSNIHVIAPSLWMKDIATNSPLLNRFNISVIPNGVDTGVFKPLNKLACRDKLKIPSNKKVILFLAHVVKDNPRKGGGVFIEVMNKLAKEHDVFALIVGDGAEQWADEITSPALRHGFVNDDELLAAIYNSADIILHPAVSENLPNSVLEAMACGVPAVAFDVGGVKDIVRHMETGYLARQKDFDDLYRGVEMLLTDPALYGALSTNCLNRVLLSYTLKAQAQSFSALYSATLK
ncbi:MAG: glycosyltransferase family 4 protein [Nitrospirae bacterium]|nr:glycosyltransferase family 4 protein [Nitrospirota bacterium]